VIRLRNWFLPEIFFSASVGAEEYRAVAVLHVRDKVAGRACSSLLKGVILYLHACVGSAAGWRSAAAVVLLLLLLLLR
jgi:hypothetical protein